MNLFADYSKEYSTEYRNSSVRNRKLSCLTLEVHRHTAEQTGRILIATQTIDIQDNSPSRFVPPGVHGNDKVTVGRCRSCVQTEVMRISPCPWTSTAILVPFENIDTVCTLQRVKLSTPLPRVDVFFSRWKPLKLPMT